MSNILNVWDETQQKYVGIPAIRGKSAYEYARDGGYTGTEEEFIASLVPDPSLTVSGKAADSKVVGDKFDELSGEKANLNQVVTCLTPEMYGAKGDGVTDDYTAIQTAIDNAGSDNVVYLAKKTYKISTGLILNNADSLLQCDGSIIYDGVDSAITIANTRIQIDINVIDSPNGIGIKLDGEAHYINRCDINVNRIKASVIGLYLYTNTNSIVYNKFTIDDLVASDTGVRVCVDAGYINENIYFIKHISGGCAKGVHLQSNSSLNIDGGYGTNANKFLYGSFEGIAEDGCSICLENTKGNIFKNIRCEENYGDKAIVFKGKCYANEINLSRLTLVDIDISELTDIGGAYNSLRSPSISVDSNTRISSDIRVSSRHGINYDHRGSNNQEDILNTATFSNNIIQQLGNRIPTRLRINSDANNQTFTLSSVYSGTGSLARGLPITLYFNGNTGTHITITDSDGTNIISNSDDRYSDKIVSIKWNGYANAKNVWEVFVNGIGTPLKGFDYFTEDDKSEIVNSVISSLPTYNGEVV